MDPSLWFKAAVEIPRPARRTIALARTIRGSSTRANLFMAAPLSQAGAA
jgi:hypothetical protein